MGPEVGSHPSLAEVFSDPTKEAALEEPCLSNPAQIVAMHNLFLDRDSESSDSEYELNRDPETCALTEGNKLTISSIAKHNELNLTRRRDDIVVG